MRKVFWDNPYQTTLITTVASVDGNRILFDETIAFSFCGGQESDKAWVNDLLILDSQIQGNFIYYTLPDAHGLKPGDTIEMRIDWERRYALMRLHFAAELVLELLTRQLNLEKIGAHIGQQKARIDFAYHQNVASFFPRLLEQYNEIINKDLPIKTGFSDESLQRRFWEIANFSKVSCGGTHVKSTHEVGLITLKRVNVGAGKERIEIKLLDKQ